MDHHATTPVAPEVFEAMRPYFLEHFGNAASRNHAFGWAAEGAVETARAEVARLIGCKPIEVVFTSGATESDNLALKGVAEAYRDKGRHLITSQVEHPRGPGRLQAAGEGRIPGDLPAGGPPRDGGPGRGRQGDHAQDGPGVHHARQQRGRDDPAPRRDRPDLQGARGAPPQRCRPGCREDPGRGGCVGGGPALPDRPQAVWAERGRGPLRSDGAAAGTPGPPDGRRRPREGAAQRYPERPGHRRAGEGVRAGRAADGRRGGAALRLAGTVAGRAVPATGPHPPERPSDGAASRATST